MLKFSVLRVPNRQILILLKPKGKLRSWRPKVISKSKSSLLKHKVRHLE